MTGLPHFTVGLTLVSTNILQSAKNYNPNYNLNRKGFKLKQVQKWFFRHFLPFLTIYIFYTAKKTPANFFKLNKFF